MHAFDENVGYQGEGTFHQTGGTNTVTNQLTIASIPGSSGIYNLSGGGLTALSIVNKDTFNYSGGAVSAAAIYNIGAFNMSGSGTRVVSGQFINSGTVKITDTTANFTELVTNDGVINNDPGTIYFQDLAVGASGYLIGTAGDRWYISNDFTNNSTMGSLWSTGDSYLGFINGADNVHTIYVAGQDLGAAGWNGNFAWGTLDLTRNIITLIDGNSLAGGALYADEILGLTWDGNLITNVFGNGINLYYDPDLAGNSYLGRTTFVLSGGGHLMPMLASAPEPSTFLTLLMGAMGLFGIRKRLKS